MMISQKFLELLYFQTNPNMGHTWTHEIRYLLWTQFPDFPRIHGFFPEEHSPYGIGYPAETHF